MNRIYAYVKYELPYLISFCDVMQYGGLLYGGFMFSKDFSSESYYNKLWYFPGISFDFFFIGAQPNRG